MPPVHRGYTKGCSGWSIRLASSVLFFLLDKWCAPKKSLVRCWSLGVWLGTILYFLVVLRRIQRLSPRSLLSIHRHCTPSYLEEDDHIAYLYRGQSAPIRSRRLHRFHFADRGTPRYSHLCIASFPRESPSHRGECIRNLRASLYHHKYKASFYKTGL